MENKMLSIENCSTEHGFRAEDGFCHLVFAERSREFYTSGLLKLPLEAYLICILKEKGYRAVVYRPNAEPEFSQILNPDDQPKTALLILPEDWCGFANWSFAKADSGKCRMRSLLDAYKEQKLILIFAAAPIPERPDVKLSDREELLIHNWRMEDLPAQEIRREWYRYVCSKIWKEEPDRNWCVKKEPVYVAEEEAELADSLMYWSDWMRRASERKFAERETCLKNLLSVMEECYQTEKAYNNAVSCGSSADELLEVSRLDPAKLSGEERRRVKKVQREIDRLEHLKLERIRCQTRRKAAEEELMK